ncbi:MAG: hypothetical protein OEY14_02345 [Myxococcales bacterium]|nr:hypothetical protein [Myxococcales bacterium]
MLSFSRLGCSYALLCGLLHALLIGTGCGGGDGPGPDGGGADAGDGGDAGDALVLHEILEVATQDPFTAPADALAGASVEGCTIYQEARCVAGTMQTCSLYEPASATFIDTPDPLLERVLVFERWYERYHSPNGLTAERNFSGATAPGTPEAEWGALSHFQSFNGYGDAAIWTGTALNAFMLRYLETGTEADYQRMEAKTRQLLTLFEVTGADGYLARSHMLLLPAGGPKTDRHITLFGDLPPVHPNYVMESPEAIADLPADYLVGVDDGSGVRIPGTPLWRGNPSIDQYTGPMVALPAAWGLLRDEGLKGRIAHHLTCYLKRLQRVEVIHLQSNPEAVAAISAWLAGGSFGLDPGDPRPEEMDRLVGYYLPQPNAANLGSLDRGCPAEVATTPTRVIDASSRTFLLDMIELAGDLGTGERVVASAIDHMYVPTLRGGDAVHLMHLATMAWHMTGDDRYKAFLDEELQARLGAVSIADTLGGFVPPRWCRSWYGDHITITPLWAFLNLLAPSPLEDAMIRVMEEEAWSRVAHDIGNAKFDLLYAGTVPVDRASGRDAAIADALMRIDALGGNGGLLLDPRRDYDVPYDRVVSTLSSAPICPTEDERAFCEDPIDLFGIAIAQDPITRTCSGAPDECPLSTGCASMMADEPVAMGERPFTDFLWQRNPFQLGASHFVQGRQQSPGLDLIESYWLARHYGFITEGEGQVLAWRDGAACP